MKRKYIFLFIFLLVLNACGDVIETSTPDTVSLETSPTEKVSSPLTVFDLPAAYGIEGSWFELYFTNPKSPLAPQLTGGADGPIVESIDAAKLSVDVAIYSLSLNSVRNALLRAHDRGVQVRMVMESDNLDRTDPQRLKDAGIPILGDRREGLMHNKFIVIDKSEVWVGGMNLTDSGTYEDNNVMMHIHSVKLAENFTKEFEEMFVEDLFGDYVLTETPNPRVTIDGTPVDTYFSPDDGVQAILKDILGNAQKSIYFMAFSFTADPLGETILERAKEGVTVAGVMDDDQVNSNQGTEFDAFSQAGLNVYRDGNPGQMHHKIMIIDEEIVIFGSYNFTNSAETRNDETLLVVYNKDIATQFIAEFQRVYEQAK